MAGAWRGMLGGGVGGAGLCPADMSPEPSSLPVPLDITSRWTVPWEGGRRKALGRSGPYPVWSSRSKTLQTTPTPPSSSSCPSPSLFPSHPLSSHSPSQLSALFSEAPPPNPLMSLWHPRKDLEDQGKVLEPREVGGGNPHPPPRLIAASLVRPGHLGTTRLLSER